MVQAVSWQHLIAEARVRTRVIPCGICGRQSGTEAVLLFCPVNIIPPWLSEVIFHVVDYQIGSLVAASYRHRLTSST
jgi:hypothetical protein